MSEIKVTIAPKVTTSTVLKTGSTGLPGAAGANGTNGTNGAAGAQGIKGDTGAVGATGATGSQGIQGATGPQGPAGANGASTWDAVTGKPSTFTPSAHIHAIADTTGLQTALDGKQASGSYAPASGISPTAITGTAVVTADSRLSDARTPTAHTHTKSQITDFPTLATVATSGSYDDLSSKPTIPAATTDASLLTSGTLADARLSTNVPLLNATTNIFTGSQSVPSLNIPYIADDSSSNILYLNGDIVFSNSTKTKTYGFLSRSFGSSNLVLVNSTNANTNLYPAVILSDNGNAKLGSQYTSNGLLVTSSGNCDITAAANTSALTVANTVTLTNTTPLLNLRSAWSTSGVAQGILLNITTDTGASNASSTLLDLQMAGVSKMSVDKTGATFTAGQTITAAANTSALTASYSVTGANTTPMMNLTGTWNTSGIVTWLKLNITDTASNAASLLMDLQTGGTTRFKIDKNGNLTAQGTITSSSGNMTAGYFQAGTGLVAGGDTFFIRDAAYTLAMRNGTNANTLRVYGTFSDASNWRRLDITSTTGGIFTLTATGNGTGASGNILKLTQPILLPSSSVTLATNGDLAFEATSNTSLTIRYRGSDGTTRSTSLTLV